MLLVEVGNVVTLGVRQVKVLVSMSLGGCERKEGKLGAGSTSLWF
jgi:hypothetical protein